MATTYTKLREIYRMATTLATVYAFANSYEVLKVSYERRNLLYQ